MDVTLSRSLTWAASPDEERASSPSGCAVASRRCQTSSVAGVTGNTSPHRRRGTSRDSAASHSLSARLVADPAGLAAQDSVLVPQHQELGVLRRLAPRQHRQAVQQVAYEQVDDRNDRSAIIPAGKADQAQSNNQAPQVRRLTSKHEAYRDRPWSADDAPPGVHRGKAAGDRRDLAGDHPDRGEGEAQPEPAGRRRRGRDHRAARAGRQGGRRRGRTRQERAARLAPSALIGAAAGVVAIVRGSGSVPAPGRPPRCGWPRRAWPAGG